MDDNTSHESLELLEAQVRDLQGIPSRVKAIRRVRKQGLLGILCKKIVRRGPGPLHFIEHNPFVRQRSARSFKFKVPALLLEDVRVEAGVKDRIEINIDEVVEILYVLTGYRVARLVRVGHGIEKGLERTFQKLHKGLLQRVFPRAAQNRMLQDVGHPRGVRRRCSKGDPKDLVLVVIDEGQEFTPCPAVAKKLRLGSKLRDLSFMDL
jgi:hypothetical protein